MKSILSIITTLLFALTLHAQSPKPKINHVAIYVKDLKITRSFYENIIGLDTIPEPFHDGRHVWFNLGSGISLHVIQGATEKKDYYKNQHTCLSVPSVEVFTNVLKKNNITWEDVKGNKNSITNRVDGVKQLWVKDPDGYWIEINDAKD
jgi:lactoylglutathione lyase